MVAPPDKQDKTAEILMEDWKANMKWEMLAFYFQDEVGWEKFTRMVDVRHIGSVQQAWSQS